jgi:hypothetical protein
MRRLPVLLALGLLVGACNADERGHVVRLDKGGYKGKPDTGLSDQARQALALRIAYQAVPAATLSLPVPPLDEVPPAGGTVDGRVAGQNY